MNSHYLVFTDLDGTLLDHYTYSTAPAEKTIRQLKALSFPIIINTSKTFHEVKDIADTLALNTPLITENGAACYFPKGVSDSFNCNDIMPSPHAGYDRKTFTQPHFHWLDILNSLSDTFGGFYKSFTELGVTGIQELTGLSAEQAEKASMREFGEPVAWKGNDEQKQAFLQALKDAGADPVEGGRFIHVCGACNKGLAMQWLAAQYNGMLASSQQTKTIALGDGKNDIAMLEVADISVRVLSPVHSPPTLNKNNNVYTTTKFGPEGWAEALSSILLLE
ncbi:HAD-IIB family hydrolase [Alteromonas facilis]|uniref:HAD-IIB family hydrolase n=1 Tax=Alteromonas facilis TaxID=2048004 RepID=UPI000C2812D4|nr:HAD-IIB family hydrolase [Alteromonas facilis]